jgi:hypothetical protein
MDYWIGCDLGSHVDFSAVSVLARSLSIDPRTGMPARDSKGDALYDWRCRALARFPLRTSYPLIARKIATIALMPELRPAPRVILDSSGVGIAVIELVRTELAAHPEVEVWGATITSGESWRVVRKHELNVSKVQLIGAFSACLHSGRFRVCRKPDGRPIDGADVLERELAAFKARQSKRSDAEIMGADTGQHDDAVLCCSIPVFAGSLRFMAMREFMEEDDDPRFRPREVAALGAEERMIRRAERAAMARELGDLPPWTRGRHALPQPTAEDDEERARIEAEFEQDPFDEKWWD